MAEDRPTLEIEIQRSYYAETAARYDTLHVDERDEHTFALAFLSGMCEFLDVRSILDVGSGTGRALRYFARHRPGLRIVGVEPVKELREMGHRQGVPEDLLIDGDATRLAYGDGEFDVVCEFGVLHHIREPARAVAEMLRVARKAVLISDSNNFGQGSAPGRLLKQTLDSLGLWKVANLIKTRGKGYTMSDTDGLAYSYSVFSNYGQIAAACRTVHVMNTKDGRVNPYRTASHIALLGIKA